jgi:hypothetical protein
LLSNGVEVSPTQVAREARVSTWLVYNAPSAKEAIEGAELEQAIARLGLPVDSTISDLTDLFSALAQPSRLNAALQHLELEWLGATDTPRPRAPFLTKAELMHVLVRSVGVDATEAFRLDDLQKGTAFSAL